MEWDDIRTAEVRGEHVIRGKVLNVWWAPLMVHVSVLDYGELLGSGSLEEWSKAWFAMWRIVLISPWAWCWHLIAQLGLSVCMWPEAGYIHFSL